MKRAGYRVAVAWIATEDDPGAADALVVSEVQYMLTVPLVADLFGVERSKVARDVVAYRRKEMNDEGS